MRPALWLFLYIWFSYEYDRKVEIYLAKKDKKIKISFVDSFSAQEVTGSNVYVETPNHKILLDCGMHQSNDKKQDYLTNNRKTKE